MDTPSGKMLNFASLEAGSAYGQGDTLFRAYQTAFGGQLKKGTQGKI